MAKRVIFLAVGCVATGLLIGLSFFAGFNYGRDMSQTLVVRGVENLRAGTGTIQSVDFSPFWEAWNLIEDNHLHGKEIAGQSKLYGAIRGLLWSLQDPYTEFFTPASAQLFQQDVQGNFGGIGAEIGIRKNQLVIIAPLKNSPAQKAQLKAGDAILLIHASSTESMTLEEAVSLIRGPVGSKAKLTIFRDGWEKPKEIEIVRERIVTPTLDYELKEGGVAYIQLYGFNANASDFFRAAIRKATAEHVRGIVLDLRNNPGGYLDVAVELAGWFLPPGQLVVSEVSRTGLEHEFTTEGNGQLSKMPVVILINKGSASASEILAGALRDNRGVLLVGEQSFGKGTVQEMRTLHDGSSIKVTIAHWVLPSGHILEKEGLKPDVEVVMTDSDLEAKKDPQLDKAIEILRDKIK